MSLAACIFDLDGVIVDTAKYHFLSWQRLAHELGIEFTEEDNKQLKGVSRMGSLQYILDKGNLEKTEEEKAFLAARKNNWYLEYIKEMNADEILPGAIDFIVGLKRDNIKVALGSGSKNARTILKKVGIFDLFEAIVDGTDTVNGKPHPEVFLKAAEALSVEPSRTIVFEDAYKGIQAAHAGGFIAIGIGKAEDLDNADLVFASVGKVDLSHLPEKYFDSPKL